MNAVTTSSKIIINSNHINRGNVLLLLSGGKITLLGNIKGNITLTSLTTATNYDTNWGTITRLGNKVATSKTSIVGNNKLWLYQSRKCIIITIRRKNYSFRKY